MLTYCETALARQRASQIIAVAQLVAVTITHPGARLATSRTSALEATFDMGSDDCQFGKTNGFVLAG